MTDKQKARLARLLYQRALRDIETGKVDDVKKAVDIIEQVGRNDALRDFMDEFAQGDGCDN